MTVERERPPALLSTIVRLGVVGGPAAVALVIALIRNAQTDLWRDEYATALFASLPPRDLIAATTHVDAVLAPYYLLMHALSPALGLGAGMRVISIAAFAGTAATVAAVACRWWGPIGAGVAGLAIAFNGEVLTAAVNARPYATSLLFVALALFAADRAMTKGSRWTWVAYAAAAVVAVGLQLFAALAVAVIGVLLVRRPWRTVLRWVAASLPAATVAVVLLIAGVGHRGQLAWLGEPGVRDAIQLVTRAGGVSAERAVAADAIILGTLVVSGIASIAVARAARSGAEPVRTRVFALILLLMPPTALFVISLTLTPVFAGKYLIWSSVGAALLLAGAAALIARPRTMTGTLAALLAVVLLALSAVVTGVRLANPAPRGDDFPALVEDLQDDAQRGDRLVIAQPYAFGGVAYGLAVSAGDLGHASDVSRHVVAGDQPVLDVRTITDADPLRTEAVPPKAVPRPGADEGTWVVTIFPLTEEQIGTVDPTLGACLRGMDFDSPTQRYGAVRLYHLDCG